MKLKVLGSSSKGNAYLLDNGKEALLIEAGVHIKEIKKALGFDLSRLKGCLVSHEHQDHARSVSELLKMGSSVWATKGTHAACGTMSHHRACFFEVNGVHSIGGFSVMALSIEHDAADPCCFFINHTETGNIVFLTDTMYCQYTFKNISNIIVEANYSKAIMKEKLSDKEFLTNRILKSHMSIETCVDFLKANDLRKVNNIVLIHLSDSNSNESDFKKQVEDLTGKTVTVADYGMEIEFNKTPF